jgi:mannosyltransferase
LAINPFHVYYSQEFRMYSLLMFLSLVSMLAYVKKHWSLSIINALLLYTHYISFVFLVFQLVYTLVFERKSLKYFLVTLGISMLLFSPWFPEFTKQLNAGVNIDTYLPGWRSILGLEPLRAIPLTLFKLVAGRIDFISQMFYAVYLTFVLAVVGFAILLVRRSRTLLVMWVGLPLVTTWIITFVIPVNQPFRLIIILPALILVLTQAVIRFPRLFLTFLLYISVAGLVMTYTRPRLQREQWRQAAIFLEAKKDEKTSVIVKFPGNFAPLAWYAPHLQVVAAVPEFPAQAQDVATLLVQENLGNKVYVVDYLGELTDPYKVVDQNLSNLSYKELDIYNFEGVGFIRLLEKQL